MDHKIEYSKTNNGVIINGSPPSQNVESQRASWGGKLEFILTTIGYAIGLGNIWRFPYQVFSHGGGAFLIPYFLMMGLVAAPMFYFELTLGQFTGVSQLHVWSAVPMMKGIGYAMCTTNFIIGWYYNVIITWSFYYFIKSFSLTLPWSSCDHDNWADNKCLDHIHWENATQLEQKLIERGLTNVSEFESPTVQFYYNQVLHMSDGIDDIGSPVLHITLCSLAIWTIIFLVLSKGIESLGKVVYVVTTMPYVVMTILLVKGCLLEGAKEGILFYLTPTFSTLLSVEVWADAATQCFYQLSLATGGLIGMSSFNTFKYKCNRDAYIVPIVSALTSVYAGFGVFSVLGNISYKKKMPIKDLSARGPGLVFIVYPEAVAEMPYPFIWSILFFSMLLLLGFSSIFPLVESIFVLIFDAFPKVRDNKIKNLICRAVGCSLGFCISLPFLCNGGFYVLSMVDEFASSFPLIVIGLLEMIAVMWIYGVRNYADDVALMLGSRPSIIILILWAFFAPIVLIMLIVSLAMEEEIVDIGWDYVYPTDSYWLGWSITYISLIWIPIMLLATAVLLKKKAYRPSPEWGPLSSVDRVGTKYDVNLSSKDDLVAKSKSNSVSSSEVITTYL